MPPLLNNHGNSHLSLGNLAAAGWRRRPSWVEIYPGLCRRRSAITKTVRKGGHRRYGRGRDGEPKADYARAWSCTRITR